MNPIVVKIIMIVLLSAMFPMVGFYLDYRARRKKFESKDKA